MTDYASGGLTAARIRGVRARRRLLKDSGGVMRLGDVVQLLGVTADDLLARRSRGKILAVPLEDGEWWYPACQFAGTGIAPGIEGFLAAFNEDVDPWTKLSVLVAPTRRFGGMSALALLHDGRHNDARSIAGTYGEQG